MKTIAQRQPQAELLAAALRSRQSRTFGERQNTNSQSGSNIEGI